MVAVWLLATANLLYTAVFMSISFPLTAAWHWRSRPREFAMLGLLGGAAALAIAGGGAAMPTVEDAPKASLAATDPLPSSPSATDLRDVAPEDAIALNASIPLSTLPLTAAARFNRPADGKGTAARL